MEVDRTTWLAVEGSYLDTALTALRRAIPREEDDSLRAALTTAAGVVAEINTSVEHRQAEILRARAILSAEDPQGVRNGNPVHAGPCWSDCARTEHRSEGQA